MEWGLLTSGMGKRCLSPSRSGRDREVRHNPNRCAVFKQGGRTELSQALLNQGRSCCSSVGRFGVSAEFSSRSQREDVARSRGNAAPCMDCVFFMKLGAPSFEESQARGCARGLSQYSGTFEACHGVGTVLVVVCPSGGTVVFEFQWWYHAVVGTCISCGY
ncbi:hypothetical protein Taro_013511 [Colocasia esculenta]|uniref:Uncharacterized protein n=1 Tax=Colocasia esculenta TaxID=4460 RepID=A0A843UC26_COLES|nr:hypothetical protein [Colocasia esculenta]